MTFHGYFLPPSSAIPLRIIIPSIQFTRSSYDSLAAGSSEARYAVYVSLPNVVIFNPSSPRSTPLSITSSFHTPSTNTCLELPQTLLTATPDQSASAQVSDRSHPHHFGAMIVVEPVACLIPTQSTHHSYTRICTRHEILSPSNSFGLLSPRQNLAPLLTPFPNP